MLELADLDALCPDWRERETWACGPAPMLDAIEEHWEDAGLEDAAAPRAVLARARRRRRRGRHHHLPQLQQDRRGRRRHHGARGRRGGRRRDALRLPDGHLPHLHAHPRRGHGPRPAQRRRVSASPTNPSRPASPPPPATARSTSDPRPTDDEGAPHGHRRRQGVHPPHRGGGRGSSDASSTRSAPTSRSRAATPTRRTSTG